MARGYDERQKAAWVRTAWAVVRLANANPFARTSIKLETVLRQLGLTEAPERPELPANPKAELDAIEAGFSGDGIPRGMKSDPDELRKIEAEIAGRRQELARPDPVRRVADALREGRVPANVNP